MLVCFGHGCTGHRLLSKHERYYGMGMDAPVTGTLSSYECYYVLGMGVLVTAYGLCMDAQVEEWSPMSAQRRKPCNSIQNS